ncbi:FAD:protein FMN transferase [Arcobacteraceae bacterium]|nr:FAD:protein FMN transferase [Arcobacteraceae bacterium]
MSNISRRKFLKITAVSLAIPFSSNLLLASTVEKTIWEGKALGANANMTLFHEDPSYAKKTLNICLNEVKKMEKIFSLFDENSSISILNKQGFINNPPKELVQVLQFSHQISKNTKGAFDVTVQPLWNTHAKFFKNNHSNDNQNTEKLKKSIQKAKKLISYKKLIIDEKKISFKKEGMKITLNGIAQGYITDKITNILKEKGFKNVLVDLGEINSIGGYNDKRDWNIATPYLNDREYITLNNMAVASSGGYGTKFNEKYHHLFDTKTGTSANHLKAVTVKAPNAMLADALSTAIYVMPVKESKKLKKVYPKVEIYTV